MKKEQPKTEVKLPDGIVKSDLEWPKWNEEKPERVAETLEFYYTERFGWVVLTLHIRNASRRQKNAGVDTARSYGIAIKEENIVTVGLGPHVKNKFTLYIKKSRLDVLQKYIDLRNKGLEKAGDIRDRISTRRANTISRRMEGWF